MARYAVAPAAEKADRKFHAAGLAKGGRHSKIHAIADADRSPRVLILTPGNTAACVMAQESVSLIPGIKQLLAAKGYATDAFRGILKPRNIRPVIPGKSTRKTRIRHAKKVSKRRTAAARCLARPKHVPGTSQASPPAMPRSLETSFPRSAALPSLPIGIELFESGS